MTWISLVALLGLVCLQPTLLLASGESIDRSELAESLRHTERAFAASAQRKDLDAFAGFIAGDAVFSGGSTLVGREAIVAGWAPFFEASGPLIRWEPCAAEVDDSGDLGLTTGQFWIEVEREGEESLLRGSFASVWRRQADGSWRVILDTGTPGVPVDEIGEPCAGASL
jgi:ketosteroid isomerase-like protein